MTSSLCPPVMIKEVTNTKMNLFKPRKAQIKLSKGPLLVSGRRRRAAFRAGLYLQSQHLGEGAEVGVLGVHSQFGWHSKTLHHTIEQRMKQKT